LQAEAKYSKLEPGRFQLTLHQPQFPEPKTALQLSPFFIRQKESNYKVERLGGELAAQRVWGKFSNGLARYRFERVNADTSGVAALYRKSIFTLGLFRNGSAPLFSPTRGTFTALEADWSGLLFGADFQYLKATLEARRYFEIISEVVLAGRAKLGTIHPLSGRRPIAPPEERFYAGGSSSVRGWQRQQLGPKDGAHEPLGGNSLFESSVELRFPVWKALGAAAFADAGNVWLTTNTFALDDLHCAAGWGLRYDTPIGPARVDLAWKLNRQSEREGKFEFHVSVGQAF
jgi:outer membrane protein insertion porin family